MVTWIALLRGVNVGGHNKLPMAEFRAMLLAQGYKNPRTYIQSGNAVFTSDKSRGDIATDIAAGVSAKFGFEPQVMLLQAEALHLAIAANPFVQAQADPTKLHLFFLSQQVPKLDEAALKRYATNGEEFHLEGEVFYLFTPNSFGRSKMAAKVGTLIKVPMTGRNLRSCQKIAELAGVL